MFICVFLYVKERDWEAKREGERGCVYIYIYIYMYMCTSIHMCEYTHTYPQTHCCSLSHTVTYSRSLMRPHPPTPTHTHSHTHRNIHMYTAQSGIYTYGHICLCTFIHIFSCMYTYISSLASDSCSFKYRCRACMSWMSWVWDGHLTYVIYEPCHMSHINESCHI